ncbi:hypothetical protein FIA58_001380 [Flavobacterium jejuense]|uniref:Gliding motility protein GldL-like N-terminal domain-containing protein n=1 Tax=Flavobacterium jejuense TaxID=1544455 RepID=A0ABX0IMX3_9FLAO|nr:hypothetical protein [Flavobacterium jejuense]NHN24312.1 hypothetical protein [Flavobacterium jejuense]
MKSIFIVRLIRLSFPIIIIGILFKIMHWPYSRILMTIGFGLIVLLYPIRYYFKKNKRLIDHVKLVLVICLPIHYYVNVFHSPSFFLLPIISFGAFIFWLILELYDIYLNNNNKSLKVFPFGILSVIIIFILVDAFSNYHIIQMLN